MKPSWNPNLNLIVSIAVMDTYKQTKTLLSIKNFKEQLPDKEKNRFRVRGREI
jgi:hypothetical protein